ncbi:MAG: HNH endonuclease, partial [Syntrophomonadaceae bacterium]|nr:HNH endonuclease [Syntrophomonadaceae bacterium]
MCNEIWKDIPGYEGEYQASTFGRIKSVKRKVISKNWYTGNPFYRTVPERILKPGRFCKSGHVSVVLRKGTSGKPVHQLILRTFIGEVPQDMEVLHINGNPTDNCLSNLRYG